MSEIYFLSASVPLTKTFSLDAQGNLEKSPYPMVKNFTSHKEPCTSLKDLYNAITKHSKLNHCMIKGRLNVDLDNEPRKGATNSTDVTNVLCIDLDAAPQKDPEAFMNSYEELKNVSYVVQYSSSYGFSSQLSCHIFVMLDSYINATLIKPWLLALNLTCKTTRAGITLTRSAGALHYPVDLTTCQNDKLLYIAPPILKKGLVSPVKDSQRVQFVAKKQATLSAAIFDNIQHEALMREARTLLNELRKEAGYEALSKTTKWVGEDRIQTKPGTARLTGIRVGDEFTHLNLNGGDSWGYYYLNHDFEFIRNFKGEDVYYTKELLPDHYRDLLSQRDALNAAPTAEGEVLLAFRDLASDKYYNGSWNAEKHELVLHTAKDTTRLKDFLANRGGRSYGDHVPEYQLHFTPSSLEVYDPENKRINTFVATKYLRTQYKAPKSKLGTEWPTIYKVIRSAVCGPESTPVEEAEALFEHLLNWIAVICQYRTKCESAWIFTGIEGTGKSMLVDHILAPILGRTYALSKPAASLEDTFTAWVPTALLVFIDEVDVRASPKARDILNRLKNMITAHITDSRAMHVDAAQVKNHLNFIFSSNKIDPIELSETDRRYNVGIYQTKKLEMTDYEVDVLIPRELDAFAQYIMTRKANKDVAKKIVSSSTRTQMIENSRTSLDEVGLALLNGRLGVLADSLVDVNLLAELHGASPMVSTAVAFESIIRREVGVLLEQTKSRKPTAKIAYKAGAPEHVGKTASKLTREDLSVIFEHCVGNMPTTPNKFSALLRHRGIHIEPIRVGDKVMRGMHVVWEISDEALQQLHQRLQPKVAEVTNIKKAKVAA